MRLKRVRIFGFKTFADRTELNIDGGFIAVVGANGCGKSNLVDAILWGLGEGNARQLRAASGQDVIFNGSTKRKPVGFAEVTLTFDNEDGALPIEATEVTITRKLTRNGDSDYSINKRNCRLRDIYELLADSGLGRAGYSIVGQKEIDVALTANADDRRAWIDEAAGVQRYRARKIESLKRLAQAQEHLDRVGDIINELESQRGPLRDEAERAQRYKQLQSSLQEVEVGLLVREAVSAIREIEELETKIASSARIVVEESAKAELLDARAKEIGIKVSEMEVEMDSIRVRQQGAITALERAEAALALVRQRLESLDDQKKDLEETAEDLKARFELTAGELATAKAEEDAERIRFDALKEELSGVDSEAAELRKQLDELESRLLKARDAHQTRLKREAELAHNAARAKDARRELAGVVSAIPDLEEAIQVAQSESEGETDLEAAKAAVSEIEESVIKIRTSEDRDAKEVRESLAMRASLEGRARGIEATIEAHEGLAQGTRAVLEASERGMLDGKYVPVGEAIETDRDYALAIETALGASANDLIVHSDSDAKRAIEWLKRNQAGRATFQPIPLMRPVEPSFELRKLLGERGIIDRASNLVQTDLEFLPVIESLLGRVLIVQDLDTALKHAKTSGWSRMVTLDGEVVHGSGAVTGGRQAKQGYGLVQRKADLAEIEQELARLDVVVNEFETRSRKRSAELTRLEGELQQARAKLAERSEEASERAAYLRALQDELASTRRSQEKLQREIDQLSGGSAEESGDEDPSQIEGLRDAAVRSLAARSADSEQAETRLREAEERFQRAAAARIGAEKRHDQALADQQAREYRAGNLGPLRDRYLSEEAEAKVAIEAARKSRMETDDLLRDLTAKRKEMLELNYLTTEEAKAARENANAIGNANHQAELNRARAESRRANSLERLFDEYGIGEDEAQRLDGTFEIPDDATTVVNRLRREMRSMGEVNLGAIDAFERLTVRYDELTNQRADILDGMEQVEASIEELDGLTRDKFTATFNAVNDAFREIFLKMFGGGEGQLSLSNEEKILDSGVNVDVTLPGKKRQPLSLLSGGERSLCAIAFLFALLQVKPSPLVVLDEVDAPLDGRNVERFAAIVQEFSQRTQFIVVTHNHTTIAAAPVWFGVTMQEPGVSVLVPTRLKDSKKILAEEAGIPEYATEPS